MGSRRPISERTELVAGLRLHCCQCRQGGLDPGEFEGAFVGQTDRPERGT